MTFLPQPKEDGSVENTASDQNKFEKHLSSKTAKVILEVRRLLGHAVIQEPAKPVHDLTKLMKRLKRS